MRIRTRLASAAISLESRIPTKDHPLATDQSLYFGLLPTDERDHLDLDTGEVFQDYNYARVDKNEKKLIDATITIRPAPDESFYKYNIMYYLSESKSDDSSHPSQIHFSAYIEVTAFRELAGNIERGLFPDLITIELEHRPQYFTIENRDGTRQEKPKQALEFGWEPDGSGIIWHNTAQENLTVPITSVRFDYAVLKARYDDGQTHRLLPMRNSGLLDPLFNQTVPIQSSLAEVLKYLRLIAAIIVALTIYGVTFTLFHK